MQKIKNSAANEQYGKKNGHKNTNTFRHDRDCPPAVAGSLRACVAAQRYAAANQLATATGFV
ncbi:hypothetical protein [Acidocella aquatica]|uniref:hypothetical protein n=1 Tax=Acidocella aquatica TaxID=1922313 RepID=UPI0024E14CC3|nr:hypothetical protein [Acidocella aquatica]